MPEGRSWRETATRQFGNSVPSPADASGSPTSWEHPPQMPTQHGAIRIRGQGPRMGIFVGAASIWMRVP
jgi:hypothetical protein